MRLHRLTLIVGLVVAVAYVLIAATTVSDGRLVLWLVIGVPVTVLAAVVLSLFVGRLMCP
jgi:hypothetical protein